MESLYRNSENIKFVLDAQFGATNEPMGTSYRSRHTKSEYIYAGKTGTSQIRAITAEEREAKIKNEDRPYKQRDHALFTAFAPYKNPRYAISVVIEHGGTGSSAAAPIAKKLIKNSCGFPESRVIEKPNKIDQNIIPSISPSAIALIGFRGIIRINIPAKESGLFNDAGSKSPPIPENSTPTPGLMMLVSNSPVIIAKMDVKK